MTSFSLRERAALCDLFQAVGPDAPTLCGSWTTRDLCAHLIIRERRPDAAVGILASFASGYTQKVQDRVASGDWHSLIERLRVGPPALIRLSGADAIMNTNEFFVHHEDVRRAQPDWEPRVLEPDAEEALWSAMVKFTKLSSRGLSVGLVVDNGTGRRHVVKDASPAVELIGPVGEIVLFLNGRKDHARVELVGPDAAISKLREAKLGV